MNIIKPELIKWARERANLSLDEAIKKVSSKTYHDWEEGRKQPTLKQIEKIAQKFYVPYGYLFLSKPPKEELPIPDFRTMDNEELKHPSINLLETIYDAQRKQNWLREQKIQDQEDKLIVKKHRTNKEIIDTITELLHIETVRKENRTYEDCSTIFHTKLR